MVQFGHHSHCWMQSLKLRFGILLVIVSCFGILLGEQAQANIEISNQSESYNLNEGMSWLEDRSRSYALDDILAPNITQQFKHLQGKRFNQGYSNSNFWFHLPIYYRPSGQDTNDKQWMIEIDYPLLESLDIYIKRADGSIEHTKLGTRYPFKERPLQYKNFLIPIAISQNEHIDVYIQLHTDSSVRMQATLYSPAGLIENKVFSMTGYGLFFGAILSMMIYNFFIYLSLKEKSYLLYISYIISFMFFQVSLSGYGYQFIWPEQPSLNLHITIISMIFCSILALQFCLSFLSLNKHAPKASHFINGFSVVLIIALVVTFFLPYSTVIHIGLGANFLSSITIIYAGIWSYNNSYKTARFFLLAWFCLLTGVTTQTLMTLHLVPDNVITGNASAIGFCFEVFLLSLALGDRINQNKLERQRTALITQQQMQKTNEELKRSFEKEERNNRLKDQFLATISHELRTPMNGAEGALALIDTEKLDKKQISYLDVAKNCAHDMTDLIESILRFSEIQSGDLVIKPQYFELRPAFDPEAVKFRRHCQKKNLDFHWHIDQQLPAYLLADKELLILILNQLTENAIKFTSSGQVKVSLDQRIRHDKPELVITINDTGEGIPPDQLENILHGFHQVDGRDNRRHTGLGIGLAICNQLSSMMQGRLNIESEAGKGTCISFYVPLVGSEQQKQINNAAEPLIVGQKNVVLIAEDNPVNQMVLRNMLVQLGCVVLTADNGQEAIDVLSQQPVDLIMMDCQMPIVDGFEATRIIRASKEVYSNIPIIAVTANAMTGDSARCITVGMNDYIKKPINRDILENKTTRWLNRNNTA